MNTKTFSSQQIEALRAGYAHIEKVDPSSPTYAGLLKLLDSMGAEVLQQLACADIKFVSVLARNRCQLTKS